MAVDAKWLEILKATSWQTAALAIAAGVLLLLIRWGAVTSPSPWVPLGAVIVLLVCGCLAIAGVLAALAKFFSPGRWIVHWSKLRRERKAVVDYIPHMTKKEREIIGYLLAHNQKMFTAASDGGHAATLLSLGIVRIAALRGQHLDLEDVPMVIPDHVWNVLVAHREQFRISQAKKDGPYPWRVHWMAR